MKIRKIKVLKKSGALALAVTMIVLSVTTTAFASSLKLVSEEGIGINVYNPGGFRAGERGTRAIIDGEKVSVSGGELWATWRDGIDFRANYDHDSKEHRCTAMNDTGYYERSAWERAGRRAISPWVDQSLFGNKAFAATR